MSSNQGLKIRYWIGIGYAIPVVLSIISPLLVVWNINNTKVAVEEVDRVSLSFQELTNIIRGVQGTSRATRGYLLDANPTSLKSVEESKAIFDEHFTNIQELIKNDEQIKRLDEVEVNFRELEKINQLLIETVDTKGQAAAIALWKKEGGRDQITNIVNLLTEFEDEQKKIFEEFGKKQDDSLNSLVTVVIISSSFIVAASLIFAFIIYFNITRRIDEASSVIASSSHEIMATVEQQERTASQQAASVNETTTTMDELGASSQQSAQQAESAAMAAQQALQVADNGNRSVEETLGEMNLLKDKVGAIAQQILRLSDQTGQIGNISQLVSDLANQTNMLALNAAVEAVRAGEHGKGFAVVASEIRKLADQSRQSAEKINNLVSEVQNSINSTVMVTDEGTKSVDSSVHIAQKSAMAFAEVAQSVNNVVLNNQQISLTLKQQVDAIKQVLDAMNSINQGARETATGIGQTRIGTQKLTEATTNLKEMV